MTENVKSGVIQPSVKSMKEGMLQLARELEEEEEDLKQKTLAKKRKKRGHRLTMHKEKEDDINDDDVFCWSDRAEKVRGQCVLILKWNCR